MKALPILGPDGWVTSAQKKLDYLMAHVYAADASQSALFTGMVSSIPKIIKEKQGVLEQAQVEIEDLLTTYFKRYFNKVEVQPVNVSTIKENAMDIKAKTSEPAADLDSLLNIQNVRPAQGASFVTKAKDQYLTPAEAIVKGEQHEEEQKDYFKIPNMGATGVSLDSNPAASAPVSILNIPAPVQEKTTYTIDDVTNKIREVVKDLESHGVKVTFDEMNFDTAYQVIIKVDK